MSASPAAARSGVLQLLAGTSVTALNEATVARVIYKLLSVLPVGSGFVDHKASFPVTGNPAIVLLENLNCVAVVKAAGTVTAL